VLGLFAARGRAMTELQAATLLQLRWRQFKATRLRQHWDTINSFEGGAARGGTRKKGAAAAPAAAAPPPTAALEAGWEERVNRHGARYLFHPESGQTRWA